MAHLDMDDFIFQNATEIYDGYKLAYGVNTGSDGVINDLVTYKKVAGTWYNADPADPNLTNLIAPMQSFIVISRDATPAISANIKSTTTATLLRDTLRSAYEVQSEVRKLDILAIRGEEKSKALLLYMNDATNNYDPEEDSYKLFLGSNDSQLSIYTRSVDGYALDINSVGSLNEVVPLAIRTSVSGEITLKFSGVASFENMTVYLNDTRNKLAINLSLQDEYTFTKTSEDDLYLEDRFYLSFVSNSPTDLKTPELVSIVTSFNGIEIFSKDGSPIRNIQVTNTQGKYLINEEHLATSNYHYSINVPGIYIVRVSTDQGTETKKVVVK
jgi:hypothetical protein